MSAATAKYLQDLASHRFNSGKPKVRSIPGWSVADLAERYSVSESTVLNWTRCEGFPPHVAVTRKSRSLTKLYDVHAVDAWRQRASFENPPVHDRHCAAVAAPNVQGSREVLTIELCGERNGAERVTVMPVVAREGNDGKQ